jgi:hypothetical protein
MRRKQSKDYMDPLLSAMASGFSGGVLVNLFRCGSRTSGQIARNLNLPAAVVRKILGHFCKSGLTMKENGTYKLSEEASRRVAPVLQRAVPTVVENAMPSGIHLVQGDRTLGQSRRNWLASVWKAPRKAQRYSRASQSRLPFRFKAELYKGRYTSRRASA